MNRKTALEIAHQQFYELSQSYLDLERLNHYLISHHSTALEGNTLTILETELFLEKGLTAKGKPLEHHLMVKDHYEALKLITTTAQEKHPIDTHFIQKIKACVMKNTGIIYHTALGGFDTSKGDLRLLNVRAGITGESYMNYDKVPMYLKNLCSDLTEKISLVKSITDINDLAFLAHYQLVTIHPFADGNGRTSRLLMNYIQLYHQMPMTIVFEEDRQAYIESLIATRKKENIELFLDFMRMQHLKFLQEEIKKMKSSETIKKEQKGSIRLVF